VNMEFLGNWNGRGGAGRYSACWGYISAQGTEYALLGTQTGTSIIDISDSLNLVERSFIPGPPSGWREMKTYRHYAYVVSDQGNVADGNGIQIIDLSNLPTSATLLSTYVWTDTIAGIPTPIPRVHSVTVSGNYLYLNGGGNYDGIRILDISDPVNPKKAGVYFGPYIHDSHVRNDTIFASAINSGGGLDIVDVRNKSNPARIKLVNYTGSGTHNAWTTKDRRFAVTTDEIGATAKSLKIWNIENIQNPYMVSEVVHPDSAIVHNVFIKGDLAYVAWYTAGVLVVDLSNPSAPQVVGSYDTFPANNNGRTYSGCWGADPYFPSGKVILSDMQTGLYVVRYTGDKRGRVTGTVRDALTNVVIPNALMHVIDAAITRWTASDGSYIFGYAPGTFRARLEAPGYHPREVTMTITEASTVSADFTLSPLVSVPETEAIADSYQLDQNYPNPFNPTTRIRFRLLREEHTRLTVTNLLGQEIATLVDGVLSAGEHYRDFEGSGLAAGVYLYRLSTPGYAASKKLMVIK
jgi:choice-of-anchor B domain-containing protein